MIFLHEYFRRFLIILRSDTTADNSSVKGEYDIDEHLNCFSLTCTYVV